MEFSFNEIKQKEVIGINDGKHLGKVCDMSFSFPENNVLGFVVTGGKGFRFARQGMFVPVGNIVKIGEDVILVKFENPDCPPPKKPPKNCPPPCPPPPCQPNSCDRRSYDEYE